MMDKKKQYADRGFLDPVPIFSQKEIEDIRMLLQHELTLPPMDWDKGYAVSSRVFYEIATRDGILDQLEMILGKDLILWGASIVNKPAGAVHPWHCDIESSVIQQGQAASVWIPLSNISPENSLQLIRHSHLCKKSVQQIRAERGIARTGVSTEEVLNWAQNEHLACALEQPRIQLGEALIFHGKIWHFSENKTTASRTAILLQYATPNADIQIPEPSHYEWPFRLVLAPKVPCILVRGDDHHGINKIVNPPLPRKFTSRILIHSNRMHAVSLPLPDSQNVPWKPYYIFNGNTANLEHVTCHVSSLIKGHCPHPPHRHREEELLILLEGEVEVILPDLSDSAKPFRQLLKSGEFVYYPAHFSHTIESVSARPANYLMIKWFCEVEKPNHELSYQYHRIFEDPQDEISSIRYRKIFEGPTGCLKKLHCHSTTMSPGTSYEAHIDHYDVAIIILEGTVQSLGRKIGRGGVIFYPAGQPHGMANISDQIAKYVVFEFHRSGQSLLSTNGKVNPQSMENESVQMQMNLLKEEVQHLKSSYSWKIGRMIITLTMLALGWIPGFMRLVNRKVIAYKTGLKDKS